MNSFGVLETEDVVQVKDKTRLSAIKSYIKKGAPAISKVQIKPEASESFIDVTGSSYKDWFLDWQYETAGAKIATLEITTGTGGGAVVETFDSTFEVITVADDKLLSSDKDLVALETDILKYVPAGRSSFLNAHRRARDLILDWLDAIRIWRDNGQKLTKDDIAVTDDLRQLSVYQALEIIFMGISNKVDDVFFIKARSYRSLQLDLKNRGRIQASFAKTDDNDDETVSGVDNKSMWMSRR